MNNKPDRFVCDDKFKRMVATFLKKEPKYSGNKSQMYREAITALILSKSIPVGVKK